MKISLNEIIKYVPEAAEQSVDELVRLIGARLVEVEGVEDWAEKYRGIYLVRVVTCEAILDTHLHLCQIDAGAELGEDFGEKKGEGSDYPKIQVVCGAPNVRAGMWAVWIAPGSIVPATYGGENFQLGRRKLRGYESSGMLAALDELDLGTDHEGILEIAPDTAPAGAALAEVFGLNDKVLEIENKSLTHRPDTFGLVGFAREVAGVLGVKFVEPEWMKGEVGALAALIDKGSSNKAVTDERSGSRNGKIQIKIADAKLCPRYSCAVLELGECQSSPFLTPEMIFLAKAGMRSISPIVDLTNILMLETGQPLHAFDYDKFLAVGRGSDKAAVSDRISSDEVGDGGTVSGEVEVEDGGAVSAAEVGGDEARIGVRVARAGEKLELLDGRTIECDKDDILITSGNVPVALAGAMGGKSTEIDADTRRIILEVATFSLYHLRKTQMRHGIFSEAITRFTKGQPAEMTGAVLAEAVTRLREIIATDKPKQASTKQPQPSQKQQGVTVLNWADAYPGRFAIETVTVTVKQINSLLGTNYDAKLIVQTLENVGFNVTESANTLKIMVPRWRTDIHIPEDIIEEVGRLNGYDNIPQSLPQRPFVMTEPEPLLRLKHRLRQILSDNLAAHEVLTYSFVSEKILKMVGEEPANSYQIVNSISPELQYFRQSLMPSLLSKLPQNLKAGYDDFAIYELNQVSEVRSGLTDERVPVMQQRLALVAVRDFYAVKQMLLELARRLGVKMELRVAEVKSKVAGVEAKLKRVEMESKEVEMRPRTTPVTEVKSSAESRRQADPIKYPIDKNGKVCYNGRMGQFSADLPYFMPGRSAELWLDNTKIGRLGEVRPEVLRQFKIKRTVAGLELNLPALLEAQPRRKSFDLSRFPEVQRDLTLKVSRRITYQEVANCIKQTLERTNLQCKLEPVSLYRPEGVQDVNYSFHITFTSFEKTLASEEISVIMEKVIRVAQKQLNAEVV